MPKPKPRVLSSGGRPTAKRVSEISDRILVAAGREFARVGGRLSLDDIAAEAQVSKQAIYRRYAGKSELIGAVIERTLNAILIHADDAVPADPTEALRHWAWRIFVNTSASTSADFSRHLQAMVMESETIRDAVEDWEKRLLEPINAALDLLRREHGAAGLKPDEAGRLLYDLVMTGSRRVSDSCRDRPVTDADRLLQFEPRWKVFLGTLPI